MTIEQHPLVSVLMPTFNSSDFLAEAVSSITNQSYTNIEILILDDASTDRTGEVIGQLTHPNIRLFSNSINLGYLQSCNFLFTQAKGSLITFQDADDWSFPDRIEKQVREFRNDTALSLCATRSRTEVTIDQLTVDSISGVSTHEEIMNYISKHSLVPFTCATIMIQRHVLDSVGPYKSFFDRIGAEHVDWALRICEKFRSKVVGDVLYYYRFNANSFTKILDYSIVKRKSLEYAKFFHIQRLTHGSDSLTGLDQHYLDNFTASLTMPYLRDPSLVYREISLDFLNKRMYKDSVKVIYEGLKIAPAMTENWRSLFIVLVRSSFGLLRRLKRAIIKS